MNQLAVNLLEKYWGLLVCLIWGAGYLLFGLVSLGPYGLEEHAARGLLLNWTISDNVINPIVISEVPDFRALLFIPVGTYWSGSMLAAKVFSMLVGFFAITLLYHWTVRTANKETALIASALLLVSPMLMTQIDALASGAYLLMGFAIGAWLDRAYRAKEGYYGGWYFGQMIFVAVLITMHPVAVAYPLALLWYWQKNPLEHKNSRHMFVGLAIATSLAMTIRGGWDDIPWFTNPVESMARIMEGGVIWSIEDLAWAPAIIAAILLIVVLIADRRFLTKDLLGSIFFIAILLGLVCADKSWALIAITLLVYRGTFHLINLNQSTNKQSFIGQRGGVAIVAFVVATFFMLEGKSHAISNKIEALGPEDELIQQVARIAADESKPFRAASQWPARTMLAAKRDVFPLPPGDMSDEDFQASLKTLTHLVFDPFDPKFKPLAAHLANMSSDTETIALMTAGTIIEVRNHGLTSNNRPKIITEEEPATEESTHDTNTSAP